MYKRQLPPNPTMNPLALTSILALISLCNTPPTLNEIFLSRTPIFEAPLIASYISLVGNCLLYTSVSKCTAFFLHGEIVESGLTDKLFMEPVDKRTEDYITGRFG